MDCKREGDLRISKRYQNVTGGVRPFALEGGLMGEGGRWWGGRLTRRGGRGLGIRERLH
jgi:hypothetical protein